MMKVYMYHEGVYVCMKVYNVCTEYKYVCMKVYMYVLGTQNDYTMYVGVYVYVCMYTDNIPKWDSIPK